jgi:DNA-binding response OmpR family regulator
LDRQRILFIVGLRSVEREILPGLTDRYEVVVASLRREALASIDESPPDLVLVDVPSIRFDVQRFCDTLSALPVPVPTMLLLGKGMRLDQMPQANGYLRHPFSSGQLLRRLSRAVPTDVRETSEWRGLCLDTENRLLIWNVQQIPLTPKQTSLCLIFLESPDTIITREQLMKEVWGTDFMGDTRTLDVHIHWLRKALAQAAAPFELVTERGVGYRLISEQA